MRRHLTRSQRCPLVGPLASSRMASNPRARAALRAIVPMTLYVPSFFSFFSTFTPPGSRVVLSCGSRS